jgi:hypothetical protein
MSNAAEPPMSTGEPILLLEVQPDNRRAGDRRAPQRTLDPLFAATLLNQIAPPETVYTQGYPPKRGVRAGIAFDLKA